jgi:PncC family amidohydrolase
VDIISELAERIHYLIPADSGVTISAAESCSGGGVASAITSVSGSSTYFLGSIVAYVNDAKHDLLHVSGEILESRGAVSSECATAMAEGSRKAFGSSLAVATTGIAGPTGATERKPVGLVYLARASAGETISEEHHFAGDRQAVTEQTVRRALELILEYLEAS